MVLRFVARVLLLRLRSSRDFALGPGLRSQTFAVLIVSSRQARLVDGVCARRAGWLADYIEARADENMRSYVLEGGISGWAHAGEEYVRFMDGFREAVWNQ